MSTPTPESTATERDIGSVTARLADTLDEPQKQAAIRGAVESEFRRFDNARVREFVPVLVERRIRTDLRALARDVGGQRISIASSIIRSV
jgi:hypothetical protein